MTTRHVLLLKMAGSFFGSKFRHQATRHVWKSHHNSTLKPSHFCKRGMQNAYDGKQGINTVRGSDGPQPYKGDRHASRIQANIFSWCTNAFIFKQDNSYRTNLSHCVRSSCHCEMQVASVLEGDVVYPAKVKVQRLLTMWNRE